MSQAVITSIAGRDLQRLIGCGLVAFTVLWAVPSYAGSGPKGIKPADSYYTSLKQSSKYTASNYTTCARVNKIKKGYSEWLNVLGDADDFIKAAKCTAGGKDPRCKEVTALRTKTCASLNAYFTSCFANPKTRWYNVADALFLAQNHKAFRDAMPLLDKWMIRIGTEKGAFWADRFKAGGGAAKYAKSKGDAVMPTGSRKSKKPKFLYTLKDKKMFLTVYGRQPRKKLKGKPKNDYLRVYVQPNAYYLVNEFKAKAKWRGNVGSIAAPLKSWRAEMAANNAHVGNWAYVKVGVYHAWITGKGWRTVGKKRVWGDMWTSSEFNATKVLVKLR